MPKNSLEGFEFVKIYQPKLEALINQARIEELEWVMDGEDPTSPRYKMWEARIKELKG